MPQLTLHSDWAAQWKRERQLLRRAVDAVGGLKVAAAILNAQPTQLGNALDERDRRFPGEWIRPLLRAAGPQYVREYLDGWCRESGWTLVEDEPLTDALRLHGLQVALARALGEGLRASVMADAEAEARAERRRSR